MRSLVGWRGEQSILGVETSSSLVDTFQNSKGRKGLKQSIGIGKVGEDIISLNVTLQPQPVFA